MPARRTRSRALAAVPALAHRAVPPRPGSESDPERAAASLWPAGVAHDLNNLLTAILGFAELAQAGVADDRVRGYLDRVLGGGRRARALVARLSAGPPAHAEPPAGTDAAAVVGDAVELARGLTPAGIRIDARIAPSLPAIATDPEQLHRVVMNLITNAAQAIDPGQGTVTVGLERCVFGGAGRRGAGVRLTVRDDGCGIDAAARARVFDPYFTTRTAGGGTGLGLYVVREIVTRQGGTIALRSAPAHGTLVEIRLPAARVPTADPCSGCDRRL